MLPNTVGWWALTLSAMVVFCLFLQVAWLFGRERGRKEVDKLLTPESVDKRLTACAVWLNKLFLEEIEKQKCIVMTKSENLEEGWKNSLQVTRQRIVRSKRAFWSMHQLADQLHYRVYPSYKDYLPKPEEDAEAPLKPAEPAVETAP